MFRHTHFRIRKWDVTVKEYPDDYYPDGYGYSVEWEATLIGRSRGKEVKVIVTDSYDFGDDRYEAEDEADYWSWFFAESPYRWKIRLYGDNFSSWDGYHDGWLQGGIYAPRRSSYTATAYIRFV